MDAKGNREPLGFIGNILYEWPQQSPNYTKVFDKLQSIVRSTKHIEIQEYYLESQTNLYKKTFLRSLLDFNYFYLLLPNILLAIIQKLATPQTLILLALFKKYTTKHAKQYTPSMITQNIEIIIHPQCQLELYLVLEAKSLLYQQQKTQQINLLYNQPSYNVCLIDKLKGKKLNKAQNVDPDWYRIIFHNSNVLNRLARHPFVFKKAGITFNRQRDSIAKDDFLLTISTKSLEQNRQGKLYKTKQMKIH